MKISTYGGGLVSSGVSLVFLSQGEGDLDGLEGGDGGDGVVVAVGLDHDVRLGGSDHISLEHANI